MPGCQTSCRNRWKPGVSNKLDENHNVYTLHRVQLTSSIASYSPFISKLKNNVWWSAHRKRGGTVDHVPTETLLDELPDSINEGESK